MRYLALILLTGCATTVLATTPRSITIDGVNKSTIGDATQKAQAHCQKWGRDAELVPDSQPDGVATFKCVSSDGAEEKQPEKVTPTQWCADDRCFDERDDCAVYAGKAGISTGCVQR